MCSLEEPWGAKGRECVCVYLVSVSYPYFVRCQPHINIDRHVLCKYSFQIHCLPVVWLKLYRYTSTSVCNSI